MGQQPQNTFITVIFLEIDAFYSYSNMIEMEIVRAQIGCEEAFEK